MNATPEYCLLWIDWWPMCMSKAEWSGWVQAIGSIAAILAGFYFVRWQINLAREDRISERVWQDLDSLESLNGSTFLLATRMSACGDQWQEGRHISEAQMTDLRSAFQVVGETQKPIFLPSHVLSDWLAVQVHAAAGVAHIESVYAAAKLGLKVVPQAEVAALSQTVLALSKHVLAIGGCGPDIVNHHFELNSLARGRVPPVAHRSRARAD